MKTKHEEKNGGSKRGNIGFYIALAVCITTIAAAAWTTYGSLAEDMTYMGSDSSEEDLAAGNDVSGQSYESTSEESSEPEASLAESSEEKPAESSSKEETESSSDEQDGEEEEEIFMPVDGGEIIKSYSGNELVYAKTTGDWRTHRGLDIKAGSGTAVRAISDGTVLAVEKNVKLGNIITIDHGDIKIRYCGLTDESLVKEGDRVKGGVPIGYIGVVPYELLDGAHLHIETIIGDTLTDPKVFLDKAIKKP